MNLIKYNEKEYQRFREPHGGFVLFDVNDNYVEEITFSSKNILSYHIT